jgi:hypothetical protein
MSIYIGDLAKSNTSQQVEEGVWVPSKLLNWDYKPYRTWRNILKDILLVIKKRGYVIIWDKKYK